MKPVDELAELFSSEGARAYLGEAVSQAQHMCQAGALAEAFGVGTLHDGGRQDGIPAVRVHGDYHLRRVMRTDVGWLVAGFGDDPLMGAAAGAGSQGEGRFASPLEDVADLCCSLSIAAAEAVSLQTQRTRAHASVLAQGWERHNVAAFVDGYVKRPGISRLMPESPAEVDVILGELLATRGRQQPQDTGAPS